jgi:L-fuconolactonase
MLAEVGLPLDVPTTGPHGLAPVVGWLDRHPDLRVVIDHLGKPPVGADSAARGEWRALLAAVAQHPLATAKLSGLYAQSGPLDSWIIDDVTKVADEALDLFGPSRLLAGGDWPIAVLAGGYDRVWSAIETVVAGLSIPDRDAVLGLSAIATYSLDPQRLARARALDHISITSEETS